MICGLIEQAAVILRTLSACTVDVTLTHVQLLQTEYVRKKCTLQDISSALKKNQSMKRPPSRTGDCGVIHTAIERYMYAMEPTVEGEQDSQWSADGGFAHEAAVLALLREPEDHKTTRQRYSQDLTLISSNKLNHFP